MSDDLRLYDVTVGQHKTAMRLNATDAAAYGADAVLATEQHPVGVVTPSAAPDPAGKSRLVTSNKMRGTDDDKAVPQLKPHERAEHHHG